MLWRKSRGLQRQNVVKQHFVRIAERVTGHGVNSTVVQLTLIILMIDFLQYLALLGIMVEIMLQFRQLPKGR